MQSGRAIPTIRKATSDDWPAIWSLFQEVTAAGDSFAYGVDTSEDVARKLWFEPPAEAHVADADGLILGTYYVRPNQPDRGAHVANAGYIVASHARGRGLASVLCAHSVETAKQKGYRAMQFNFVVSTNDAGIKVWERCGFHVVGRLPGAFRHDTKGYVDALVFFRDL